MSVGHWNRLSREVGRLWVHLNSLGERISGRDLTSSPAMHVAMENRFLLLQSNDGGVMVGG